MNPELRRNLWLQFSLLRLVLAPIAIGALLALSWVMSDQSLSAVAALGETIYYLLILLWGSRRAADLVAEEIAAGTWDGQRMSALGAWQMTWGKLTGGTSYVWYCAGLAFFAYLAARWAEGARPWQAAEAVQLLRMLLAGLLAQSVAFLVSLALLRRQAMRRRLGISISHISGILAGAAASGHLGSGPISFVTPEIAWYGRIWAGDAFVLASLAVFLAWSIFGIYRLMRIELRFRGGPWAWLAFALFLMVYGDGFLQSPLDASGTSLGAWVSLPFIIALFLTYAAVFLEPKDVMRYRWLGAAIGSGELRRAQTLLPEWLPTYVLTLGFAIVLALFHGLEHVGGLGMLGGSFADAKALARAQGLSLLPLALAFYLQRDVLLVLYLNFGPRGRRGDASAFIILVVVYFPLVGILHSLDAAALIPVLAPYPLGDPVINLLVPLAEGAALAGLLLGRLARAGRFAAVLA